jgi:hypothetical protein
LLLIYPELEKDYPDFFNSNTVLRQFLTQVLDILKNTDDIQEYRRALVSVSLHEPGSSEDEVIFRELISFRSSAITRLQKIEVLATEDRDKLMKIRRMLEEISTTSHPSLSALWAFLSALKPAAEILFGPWENQVRMMCNMMLLELTNLLKSLQMRYRSELDSLRISLPL